MRMRSFFQIYIITIILISNSSLKADIVIDSMRWFGTNADGTSSLVYNYTPLGGAWRLFIESGSTLSGSFINTNESGISLPMSPGNYTYSFAGDAWESGQSKRYYGGISLRVRDTITEEVAYFGAWAPIDTSHSFEDIPVPIFGQNFAKETKCELSGYSFSVNEFFYTKDGSLGYQDWASPFASQPNGRTDTVGYVSFEVQYIAPVPSTLAISSTDGGSVGSPGEGVFAYDQGEVVEVEAVSDSHYHFANWTGTAVEAGKVANFTSASTTVTMDADYDLMANFAIDTHTLTTSSNTGGAVTIPGEGVSSYDYGTVVDLVAMSEAHYHFVEWVGPVGDSTSSSTSVTVSDDMEVQAEFSIDQFNVILSSTMGGTIVEPGEGEFLFDYGTKIVLEAWSDDSLFEFSHFTGSLTSSANPYRYFIVTGDSAIHAVFHSLQDVLYVDGSIPAGQYENGTDEYPFDSIREAIEVAKEGATVVIRSGIYCENLELPSCSLTLTGVDINDTKGWAFPVIEGVGDAPVVTRRWGADAPVLMQGLIIRGGDGRTAGGIDCRDTQITLENCLLTGNRCNNTHGLGGAVFAYDSQVNLVNCTVSGNYSSIKGAALYAGNGSTVTVLDSILWDNVPMEILSDGTSEVVVQYSDLTDLIEGEGNLNEDPLFVSPGYWAHALNPGMSVSASHTYAIWQAGDYHLDVNSPCIDAGDPNESGGDMGAYGNTPEATEVPEG